MIYDPAAVARARYDQAVRLAARVLDTITYYTHGRTSLADDIACSDAATDVAARVREARADLADLHTHN